VREVISGKRATTRLAAGVSIHDASEGYEKMRFIALVVNILYNQMNM